jgi:hypothetical protein
MCFAGIFSFVYEAAKFPDPGPVLQFNGPTVILRGEQQPLNRVLAAGEQRPLTLTVRHYGPQPIVGGRLSWKVCAANSFDLAIESG